MRGRTAKDFEALRDDLGEHIDWLVTVARGLEGGFRSGRLEFNYDDDGKPESLVVPLGGTSRGRSSDSATVTVEKDSGGRGDG